MSNRHTPAGVRSALYKCKDCSLVYSFDGMQPIRECTACGNTTNDLGFSLIHDGIAMHGGIEETKLLLRRLGINDADDLLVPERAPVSYGVGDDQRTDEDATEELIGLHESIDDS